MQNKDSIQNTVIIGLGLCFVCAAIISFIAVGLKQTQKQNVILDQQKKIVAAADLESFYGSVTKAYDSIEEIVVDLDTGNLTEIDPKNYDLSKELQDNSKFINLTSSEDIATIKVRENFSKVFLEYRDGELNTVILPVRGYGLWGILYGYLAISDDLNTIVGLEFYEHKETPGLGAEIDNPAWKALWNGKKLFDYKGISRQSTAVRDQIDLGIYNTGSMFGIQNNDGKDLGNIVVLFDEIRVSDSCTDLKLEDFKYKCSALN
mgnify:CR=1 FL=1